MKRKSEQTLTSKEIEAVLKNLKIPTKKNTEPDGFMCKFDQTFIEELMPTLFKLLQKTEEQETLPNSFKRSALPSYQSQTRIVQEKKTTNQYI